VKVADIKGEAHANLVEIVDAGGRARFRPALDREGNNNPLNSPHKADAYHEFVR